MTPGTLDNMRWVAHHDPESVTPDWLVERLDALESELDEKWLRLPLDADGMPIHVGDMMDDHGIEHGVMAVSAETWVALDGYSRNAKLTRHVKPRTIEDVLADFAADVENGRNDITTARRYADEIRELMGVER